ncbi:MAG: lipid-A-disaccharide synthase [Candidatus Omnitrophica bacterium]|nr:lipid-A-disaccharide synthase [Candidatus Omnitrophota bacterium]MDD5546453.1 lipid-A-disaccharide synthase [Candidatus Omnitrophota bacterium]
MPKKIMIIAGEASGDLHGSSLVLALKELEPDVKLVGMGGEKMIKAGLRSFQDIKDLSVIGLLEILSSLKKFKDAFNLLAGKLDSEKPDAVILIDYPEFNLRFAKEAKKRGIPVIYYISPQIWAWRKGRVNIVKKYVGKMIVILKFEKDFYSKEGVDVEFVGHPLLDVVKPSFGREEFLKKYGLEPAFKTIALLPGSRLTEIERNLPIMLKAAKRIKDRFGDTQFILAKPPEIKASAYEKILKKSPLKPAVAEGHPYDCINAAELVLVASGTATVETMILEKPMLIIYKVSLLTWLVGKLLVKVPNIGLVNIIAGEKIVPELVQFDATPSKISSEVSSLFSSLEKMGAMKVRLAAVKAGLGGPGASRRAAEIILKQLRK